MRDERERISGPQDPKLRYPGPNPFNSWERNEAIRSYKRLGLEQVLGMLPTEETAIIEEVQETLWPQGDPADETTYNVENEKDNREAP